MAERVLFSYLTERISNQLLLSSDGDFNHMRNEELEEATQALLSLSKYRINLVVEGIVALLQRTHSTLAQQDEGGQTKSHDAIEFLIDLLHNCLRAHWEEYVNALGLDVRTSNISSLVESRPAPTLSVAPVGSSQSNNAGAGGQVARRSLPLETKVFQNCVRFIWELYFKFTAPVERVVKLLSLTNWENLLAWWKFEIQGIESDVDMPETCPVWWIPSFELNVDRLSRVLETFSELGNAYPKKMWYALSEPLRRAVWIWIASCPQEFVTLHQESRKMKGDPHALLAVVSGRMTKNKRKNILMTLHTTLLLLSPSDLSAPVEPNTEIGKCVDNLSKAFKVKALLSKACHCTCDLLRAGSFLPHDLQSHACLRDVVASLEAQLRNLVLNNAKPMLTSEGTFDTQLLQNYLVADLLNPRSDYKDVIECQSSKNPHVRQALLRAFLVLVQQSRMRQDLSLTKHRDLRGFVVSYFKELVDRIATLLPKKDGVKKSKAVQAHVTEVETILTILDIIREDQSILFHAPSDGVSIPSTDGVDHDGDVSSPLAAGQDVAGDDSVEDGLKLGATIDSTFEMISRICQCVGGPDPDLRQASTQAIRRLFEWESLEALIHSYPIDLYWTITAATQRSLSTMFIEFLESSTSALEAHERTSKRVITTDEMKLLMDLFLEVGGKVNGFLSKQRGKGPGVISRLCCMTKEVKEQVCRTSAKVEACLLLLLSCWDSEICSKAAKCFGICCDELDIIGELDSSRTTLASNYHLYRGLSTMGVLVTGRAAQQKAIRTLLRRVEQQTTGNIAAWERAFSFWQQLSRQITMTEDDTSPNLKIEWQNYTGLLCALAGVCLRRTKVNSPVGSSSLDAMHIPEFLETLLEMVVSDKHWVRDTVLTSLGSALSPAAYAILFQHFQNENLNIVGSKAGDMKISGRSTVFVENALSIVRRILEQPQDESSDLALADFETLIQSSVRYVSQVVVQPAAARIRLKLCGLLEAMMARREFISFQNLDDFRAQLLHLLTDWSDSIPKSQGEVESLPFDETEISKKDLAKLFRDLELLCMKAISSLLQDLSLQRWKGDPSEASRVFVKFFNFLTRFLSRCRQGKEDTPPELSELTILSLGNLLDANIELGLDYFVTMGYHEDADTRAAFLTVLTRILKEKTEDQFLSEVITQDKYDELSKLLLDGDFLVAQALFEAIQMSEADEVAGLFVSMFTSSGSILSLLERTIEREVDRTMTPGTLFRASSIASKLMGIYSKRIGILYQKDVISDLVEMVVANDRNFELDPSRITDGSDCSRNAEHVKATCSQFLERIISKADELPIPMRSLCQYLRKTVEKKFPEAWPSAIGGFIFLRFFCPGIVAPDAFGHSDVELSQNARRFLVLITKVLQNLANGVTFGAKEPYMSGMNDFLQSNTERLHDYFRSVSVMEQSVLDNPESDSAAQGPTDIDEGLEDDLEEWDKVMGAVHFYLDKYLQRIEKFLSARSSLSNEKEGDYLTPYDRLTSCLTKLGPAPERAKTSVSIGLQPRAKNMDTEVTNILFEEFMMRNQSKDISAVKDCNLFYQNGFSTSQHPVFYYIARQLNKDTDFDSVIYYLLNTLKPYFSRPYEVVIDTSLFEEKHTPQASWFVKFYRLIPRDARRNLVKLYIVYPNAHLKKLLKRISRYIPRWVAQRVVATSNPSGLAKFVPDAVTALPEETLKLEKDITAMFSPVSHDGKDSMIRISASHLHLIVSHDVLLTQSCSRTEFFRTDGIQKIEARDASEFVIHLDKEGRSQSMGFTSVACKQIVAAVESAIHHCKKASELAEKQQSDEIRTFHPSDVPGTLLNMALLNLGGETVTIRGAANNLLAQLRSTFNFPVETVPAEELCVPRNSEHIVVTLSKRLATHAPQLTAEVIRECFHGYRKVSLYLKHMCIDYVLPWIENAGRNIEETRLSKVEDALKQILDLTIEDTEMYPVLLASIWPAVGASGRWTEICMQEILEKSFEPKIPDAVFARLLDVTMALVSKQNKMICNLLVTKLLKNLDDTSNRPDVPLERQPNWHEINTLCHFVLSLTFENNELVESHLPVLFHIVILLFGTGPVETRVTIHSLVMNLIHTLCSQVTNSDYLTYLLGEFATTKYRIIFVGKGGLRSAAASSLQVDLQRVPITNVSSVATALMDVLSSYRSTNPSLYQQWHRQWWELEEKTAFHGTPSFQPRSLVTLGVIARPPVRHDVPLRVLELLKGFLDKYSACFAAEAAAAVSGNGNVTSDMSNSDYDLPISLILCLSGLIPHLSHEFSLVKNAFWLSVGLLHLGDAKLYPQTCGMMEVVLKCIDAVIGANSLSLEEYLGSRQSGSIQSVFGQLQKVVGISFSRSFAFAIVATLLKGLLHEPTKPLTLSLLGLFVDITAKNSSDRPALVGYLSAMLCASPQSSVTVTDAWASIGDNLSGEEDSSIATFLFAGPMFSQSSPNAALFITLLHALLQNTESENDLIVMYGLLETGIPRLPGVFAPFCDLLLPSLTQTYRTCQSRDLSSSIMSLIDVVLEDGRYTSSKVNNWSFLSMDLQFQGLLEAGSFKSISPERRADCARLCASLVTSILQEDAPDTS